MKRCYKYLLLSLLTCSSLSSCSLLSSSEDNLPQVYTGYTAKYIYAKAHQQMTNNDYYDAIKSYKSLNSQYPFTKYSENGTVDLVYLYYQNDEPALSLALAKQFLKMYPYSKYQGYIYYIIGIIGYDNGRGVIQKYFTYDMDYHAVDTYIDSYHNFEKAIKLNPKGNFVNDAKRRMIKINNLIGKHYLDIAEYYYKRGAYDAAINRASEVIENYPQSISVEEALIVKIKSYRDLGLRQQMNNNLDVLKLNYPNNSYLTGISKKKEKSLFDKFLNLF